jgi:hypothetical protein
MRIRSIAVTGLLLLFPFLIFAQQKKIYLDPNDDFSAYFPRQSIRKRCRLQ